MVTQKVIFILLRVPLLTSSSWLCIVDYDDESAREPELYS